MKSQKINTSTEEKNFEVDYIITRKTETESQSNEKYMYLVKWVGYPIKQCTWEPMSNLENISDMVEEFDRNFPKSINEKALKEFLLEYKKYEHKLFLQKKRELREEKNKLMKRKKFVISIVGANIDNTQKKKDEDMTTTEHNEDKKENTFINIEHSGDEVLPNVEVNLSNEGKLKRPIMRW